MVFLITIYTLLNCEIDVCGVLINTIYSIFLITRSVHVLHLIKSITVLNMYSTVSGLLRVHVIRYNYRCSLISGDASCIHTEQFLYDELSYSERSNILKPYRLGSSYWLCTHMCVGIANFSFICFTYFPYCHFVLFLYSRGIVELLTASYVIDTTKLIVRCNSYSAT